MFRKTIFWVHLGCGVLTGLVVLMMSVTGVVLTYERQMLAWQTREFHADPPPGSERLRVEAIVASAARSEAGFQATSVQLSSNPRAPALLAGGRAGSRYLNTYTGELLGEPPTGLDSFFNAVTGWHRWFNAPAESRAPWRAITGVSNLAFLFLIVSGMYLWLPRIYKWTMFRAHLFFSGQALRGKARDYNWHHVFGIWTAIPLFIVVATATVFSYPWASNAVYRAFGEEPPAGRGGGPGPAAQAPAGGGRGTGPAGGSPTVAGAPAAAGPATAAMLELDALFARASTQVEDWKTITMTLPQPGAGAGAGAVSFTIDQGNGGQPQLRHTLVLDAATGDIASWQPFESQTPGRRARSWIRFLHTGEALGLAGQTIAGIVSLTSVIMVWTGLALAWRRLVSPLFRRRAVQD
jgi:uncharacterized iron-regulated membrane protein